MAEEQVDKKVIIDSHTVAYATSVKANPETNVSTTQTFDGAITQGMDKVAWSIELSKVRFESSTKHKELNQILDEMLANPKRITIIETVHSKDETYTIRDDYDGCILESNDYEIKPDDNTSETLKFKASKRKREYE